MSAPSPQDRLDAALARIPYVKFLGLRCELAGDEMTAILPPSEHLIGNTSIPALHGGVVGAFLELTALAELIVNEPARRQPRTIDVTIDYPDGDNFVQQWWVDRPGGSFRVEFYGPQSDERDAKQLAQRIIETFAVG